MNIEQDQQNTTFNNQISSFIDEKDKRSTFNTQPATYEEGYDMHSQNGVSKDQLLSPIPHAMQPVEYHNFGTFSQQKPVHENEQQPVKRELDLIQSDIQANAQISDHFKSKTEYSYQDFDNVPLDNRNERQGTKGWPNRRNNKFDDSTSSYSSRSDSDHSSSLERNHKSIKNQKKYRKLKKVLCSTKKSLDKTQNMLEIQKYKNESQEERIKALAMEIENIKRHSYEHMMTNKSLQPFAMNNQIMGYNQIENYAYNTQRPLNENRLNDNTSQCQMIQSVEKLSGSND